MKRRDSVLMILCAGLCIAACLIVGSSPATAESSEREETWQFYIPLTYISGQHLSSGPSSIDLSSDMGWGFAFGYNFTERWSLGFEITWTNTSYVANIAEDTNGDGTVDNIQQISSRLDASSLLAVGQFNFMETRVTPFIRAGLGTTFMDTNIPSGPPVGSCWWDPWWWVWRCGYWTPTYGQNAFSYGGGVGVRGDINDSFYLEASYNQLWIDLRGGPTPKFRGGRLNMGWRF